MVKVDWAGFIEAVSEGIYFILKEYTIPQLIYLADQADVKATYLQTLDLAIWAAIKD